MADLQLEVIAENFVFIEGPRWRNGRLWFSDMLDHTVFSMTETGEIDKVAEVPNRPSGLNFLPDGRLVTVSMVDRKLYVVEAGGILSEYADLSGLVSGDPNDSVVDTSGNIYVGNTGVSPGIDQGTQLANLVCVTPDGQARVVAESMQFPNGTVITPDGRTLICAETHANCLTAFDLADDGSLSNRRVWAHMEGHEPDGISMDAEGAIWVASFGPGEFLRIVEGGDVTARVVARGKQAMACCLGGADGRTLFCLTHEGPMENVLSGARDARVEVCRVDVPASGSP